MPGPSLTESGDDGGAAVPERLLLTVGDRSSIALPGLASAGYEWTAAVVDHQPAGRSVVSADVTVVDDRAGSDRAGVTSDSLPVEATIVAQEPGWAAVRLTLARSWQSEPPLRRHDIEVTVQR